MNFREQLHGWYKQGCSHVVFLSRFLQQYMCLTWTFSDVQMRQWQWPCVLCIYNVQSCLCVQHCRDTGRSHVILQLFRPVLYRILKHNVVSTYVYWVSQNRTVNSLGNISVKRWPKKSNLVNVSCNISQCFSWKVHICECGLSQTLLTFRSRSDDFKALSLFPSAYYREWARIASSSSNQGEQCVLLSAGAR